MTIFKEMTTEDPFWTLNSDLTEVREEAMKIYGEIGMQKYSKCYKGSKESGEIVDQRVGMRLIGSRKKGETGK